MPATHLVELALGEQLVVREVRNGLQQRNTQLASVILGGAHHAEVDERGDGVERVEAALVELRHGGDPFEVGPASEHAEPSEHDALVGSEQVVAPGDGVAEALLAGRSSSAGCTQVERRVEARQQARWRQQLAPCTGELERQRQPVEPAAERDDVFRVVCRQLEPGPHHFGVLAEQLHRGGRGSLGQIVGPRQFERPHRELVLAPHVEGTAGCDHHGDVGR